MVPHIQNEGSDRVPDEQGARSTPDPQDSPVPDEALFRVQLKMLWAEITAALKTDPTDAHTLPKVLAHGDYLQFEPARSAAPAQQASTGKLMMYALGGIAGVSLLTAALAALQLPAEECLEELTKISALLVPLAAAVLVDRHRAKQVAQIRSA